MKTRTVRSKRQEEEGKFIYMSSDITGKIYSTEPKCCCTTGLPEKAAGAASVRDHACEAGTSCWKLDWNSGPKPPHSPMQRPSCFNTTLCCIFVRAKAGWLGLVFFFWIPWVCPRSLPADFWEWKFSKMIKTACFFLRIENWFWGFYSFGRWKITAQEEIQ